MSNILNKIKFSFKLAVFSSLALIGNISYAQNYPEPDKKITIIVPFAANGSTDKIARIIAEPLAKELKTTIDIKNVGGLGGSIGTLEIAQAKSDGYTLGILTLSSFATYPALNPSIQYDPANDFTYIVNIAKAAHVLAVNNKFPAKDFASFLESINKKKSSPYSYASSGTGGMPNLLMEYLQMLTQTKLLHIPFKGSGTGIKSVVLGSTDIILDQSASILPLIAQNKLIPIAVGNDKRLSQIPNVPTFTELGYPQLNRTAFYGLIAPKNLPATVLDKLNKAVNKIIEDKSVKAKIKELGFESIGGNSEQFKKDIQIEIDEYKKIVSISNNITLDNS